MSPDDPEDLLDDEEEEHQDDEIIGKAFRGSIQVFVAMALIGLAIWWINQEKTTVVDIDQGDQVPVRIRDVNTVAPTLHFTDITKESGIDFVHENGARGEKLLPETMGSGAAFVDIDLDGDVDLILASGRPWPWSDEQPETSTVRLWINDGTGSFSEATQAWNLTDRKSVV